MSQSPVSLVHSKLGKSPSGAHLSQYACATIKHKQTSTTGLLSKEQDFVLMTQEVWNSKVKKLAGFVSGEDPLSIFTLMAMHCYLAHWRGRRLYSRLACKNRSKTGLNTLTPNEAHSQWGHLIVKPSGQDPCLKTITPATGLQHVTLGGTFPNCSRALPEKLKSGCGVRTPESPHYELIKWQIPGDPYQHQPKQCLSIVEVLSSY